MSGLNKITVERNQKTILELVVKPGNDICADCKARNPRWASHNLGIFICVNCASIHRKIGTHITKVKSLTMDSWTKEQVESMKAMGNVRSNAIFNPNELRHPLPPNLIDSERDSELEQYIRSKYEFKRFIDKSALVASKLGPSRSASSVTSSGSTRSVSTPLTSKLGDKPDNAGHISSTGPQSQQRPTTVTKPVVPHPRSVSQPLTAQPSQTASQTSKADGNAPGGVWADLVSLQTPSTSSSLPLQFQTAPPVTSQQLSQGQFVGSMSFPTGQGMGLNPYQQQSLASNPYSQSQQQQQYSPSTMQPSPYSMGGLGSYSPSTQPQQYFPTQTQFQPPMSAPGQFYQSQPQQSHLQIQAPLHNPTPFASPAGGPAFMSAPAHGQFMSSSPGNPFSSHSPQPQMQMPMTPQPQVQMPMQQGQFASHSPQAGMGVGMAPQNQFLSTTPQPQMQMQPGQYMGGMQMMQPQGQFGGFQGQQMFPNGGYSGQQWGGM